LHEAIEFARAALAQGVPEGSDRRAPAGFKLSRRERELLDLVAEGLTDNQISEKLFISVRTVRSHLDRIRDKTGYRRRAELTRLAIGNQLTSKDAR
jgi:DNA-binding CsgD family transcriptional regulator